MAAQPSQLRGLCRPNRPCRSKVDVLIVGAGPAGCSLGLLLRRAGMDVLIAEAKEIRGKNKLCGGVLLCV